MKKEKSQIMQDSQKGRLGHQCDTHTEPPNSKPCPAKAIGQVETPMADNIFGFLILTIQVNL